jgi:hypothetical protein
LYLTAYLTLYFGVEEKSVFERFWDLITGGGVGLVAGVAFFVVFGAIGWVSGALFGAIGLFGLAFGGALGGLGLGALVNVVRDPGKYNYHWGVIALIVTAGAALTYWLWYLIERKFPPDPPNTSGI